MPTADQNIQDLNPQDPYSWIPEGANQQVQDSLQQLESKQDPLKEVAQAVKEEQSIPQEEFINKIKRLREEADERNRKEALHQEIVKENEARNKGFTAEKMSNNYLQFVKDQEKLSQKGKDATNEKLEGRRLEILEKEIAHERAERLRLEEIVKQQNNELQELTSKNQRNRDSINAGIKRTDTLTNQVNTLLEKIEALEKEIQTQQEEKIQPEIQTDQKVDTNLPSDNYWVGDQDKVASDTDEVAVTGKFKQDPNESQWTYEYPEENKDKPSKSESTTNLKQPYTLDSEGNIVDPDVTEPNQEDVVPPVVEPTPEQFVPEEESKEEETPFNERQQKIVSLLVKALGSDTQVELSTSSIIVTLKIEQKDIPANVKALTDIAITIVRPQQTNLNQQ